MKIKNERRAEIVSKTLITFGIVLLLIVLSVSHGFPGKQLLQFRNRGQEPSLYDTAAQEERMIAVDGKVYRFRNDVITILCMGIDIEGKVSEINDDAQSDAVYLLVVDPKKQSARVVGISRDTMTDVEVRDVLGNYLWTKELQLTLQYAYGDGKKESCELTQKAVSKLLFDLPVNGYCALSLGAIKEANDLVGGVEVTVHDDLTLLHPELQKGKTLLLNGEQAFAFVKERSIVEEGSSYGRMERQKQYMSALADKARTSVKKNPFLLWKLFRGVSDYMVTDMNAAEIMYLAGACMNGGLDFDSVELLPGEIVQGEKHEQFYMDMEAAKALMLELYYDEL